MTDFLATIDVPAMRLHTYEKMQWRGSSDGIIWSAWRDLPNAEAFVWWEGEKFAQGRIMIEGRWHYSKIETWN